MEFIALAVVVGLVVLLQHEVYRRYAMRYLEYDCRLSVTEAYEGDEIELIETISNKKWLPIPWLKSEITTSKWLEFAGSQSVITGKERFVPSFFLLKSYHKVVRRWKVTCLHRGELSIGKVVLVATDLLGTGSYSLSVPVDSKVTVLPKIPDLPALVVSPSHMCGDIVVKRHLISDPFLVAGVREYAWGDPMNRIHWAATAKQQSLMVRNQEYTSSQSLAVILNMQTRPNEAYRVVDEPVIDLAVHACAAYFDQTIASGIPVGFWANSTLDGSGAPIITNTYWGAEHVEDLLRLLAVLPYECAYRFDLFLADLGDKISATDIVLLTAALTGDMIAFARRKAFAGVRVKLLVVGSMDDQDAPADCETYYLYDSLREQPGA